MKKKWDFESFEITAREILASISIIAILLLIGVLISSKISDSQIERNEKYNKAVKIQDAELFQYGMDTNIGNAFMYGNLKTVDTVTYPEIGGKYMSVSKYEEHYTKHTETVYEYDGKGKVIGSHEEEYWTWDLYDSENKNCKNVTFLGIKFKYGQIYKPREDYIGTLYDDNDSNIRYDYYGSKIQYKGTAFGVLKNHTINNAEFYKNMNIEETVQFLESDISTIVFWVVWVVIIAFVVYGFYYLDNKWLE